ncbi:MAG: T9SS type A sorting domain-containing protein [Elusimicrobia bacterium]|nr:T9SS type A sorting domain-containing protein [Elusimicrobiota bacterium]
MRSNSFRILISEQATVGNSVAKTGGGYSLLGSTGQMGAETPLSGGRYTVSWGAVNSWRPAQADVSAAHVYPNPCNIRNNCTSVTFTRLTLRAEVDIYTLSGELVKRLKKSDNTDSVVWRELKNDNGSTVASGLYLYLVKGEGSSKSGKLVLIR